MGSGFAWEGASMEYRTLRLGLAAWIAGILLLPAGLLAQQAVSHVRVVRLSYVSGTVAVRRPGADDWAKAMVNTPIQEGFDVQTSAASYAEVEFENGSTARLGELSRINFSQLALDADGNKLNRLTFEQGYATFHILPEHRDAYSVKVADATLTPSNKTEFRTDLRQGRVRVEVFNGSVEVVAPSGSEKLGKDKVLEYNTNTPEVALDVHHGIQRDAWDQWTEARDTQTQLALGDQAVSPRGPQYGWSDLNTYGEWAYIPGYGNGWAPYAPAGWSPYGMGMWGWYSGMGWTWTSSEPWGWLPYHYGMWDYDASLGWFWLPGSFGAWSPALVNWYSGPGWLGWAPLGVRGSPGFLPVTTVAGNVIQNGQMITPQTIGHVHRSAGTAITQLPFQPTASVLLSGGPVAVGAVSPGAGLVAATHATAPSTILMGGDGSRESALFGAHQRSQPLRARLGTTLGGRFVVGGTLGEFRSQAGNPELRGMNGSSKSFRGSSPGPEILPHGQSSASLHADRDEMMHAGGGGNAGSVPSGQSNVASSPHSPGPSPGGQHH
jgi:hypothetical protein